MEWGFLPFSWKPSGQRTKRTGAQRKCVNAISEELESKPTYRAAFKSRRCLMPAMEFLEPDLMWLFTFAALRPQAVRLDRWLRRPQSTSSSAQLRLRVGLRFC